MNLYAVDFKCPLSPSLFARLVRHVDDIKRDRILGFRSWEDSHRVLLGDLLSRYAISLATGTAGEEIRFGSNEFGKPWVQMNTGLHFNVSHSGGWVVCAVAGGKVGIDIERIEAVDLSSSRVWMDPGEAARMEGLDPGERISFFYTLWTLKESFIKAVGRGLDLPMNSFSIQGLPGSDLRVFKENEPQRDYRFQMYDLGEGYKTAVCAEHNGFPDRFTILDVRDVLSRFS